MRRLRFIGYREESKEVMIEAICPLCGIGALKRSSVTGYECDNCGEVFTRGKDAEWEVIPYEEWLKYVREKDTGKHGTKIKSTGGKRP